MKTKSIISIVLGVIISALTLYLAFRNVPFTDLVKYLTSINYFWIIPSSLVIFLSFALRAFRWQVILESSHKVGFWQAFHPLMIGFMINCILPLRVGEIARPAVLQKKENIPFSTGLATVAAERVFDVIILIIVFAVLIANIQIDPNLDISFGKYQLNRETLMAVRGGMFKLLLLLIVGIIMVGFSATRKAINRLIMRIPSLFFFAGSDFKEKIQKKACTPLVSFVENFASGFALIKYPRKIFFCLALSVIIWVLAAYSYYLMAQGCPGIELSFTELSTVMIIICFFIALPSVPGYWGLWEASGVFALIIFDVSSKDALGFTLVNHVIQIFTVIIVGFISATITSVNIWQVSYEKSVT
jgi:uncharacterized protein (TIRG00374 family)